MFGMGTWIKIGAALVVILVIYLGYTYVVNLQEANAQLTADVATLALSNKTLTKERDQIKTNLKIVEQNRMVLNQELTKSREDVQKVVRLFSDHDFSKLAKAKPGLITKRMQRATKELFKEFERVGK